MKLTCPDCGNDGSENGLYRSQDFSWDVATQSWAPGETLDEVDCLGCDANFSFGERMRDLTTDQ